MTETLALIEPLGFLESGGALTPTGLVLDDPDMTYDRWAALGRYLGQLRDLTAWALGDWLVRGEAFEGWEQAVDGTGRSYDSLRDYRYVCSRFAHARRLANLSFGHHRVVASLEPSAQTKWLERADTEDWSVGQLRQAVRDAKAIAAPPEPAWTPPEQKELLAAEQDAAETGRGFVVEGKRVEPDKVVVIDREDDPPPPLLRRPAVNDNELVASVRRLVWSASETEGGYLVPKAELDEVAALAAAED